ncbi:MAG: hypothetical protein KF876_02155 [Nitrospira sp.]|nr:hypothetical protein [Nitrospira sp.]MDR4463751.1 hypothetical protein [Nitrospira sp.]MDR4468643.1 hypothetical protein [Nitrospira sp.]
MRTVLALGAAILCVGSLNVAVAQERLQQSSGGSAMGVGTGVGDVSGSANRVQTYDRNAFLDRLSLPETIYGRVLAIDFPAGKMLLESGGSSHDEGRAGAGAMSSMTVYFDEKTNMDQLKVLNNGDDISLQVVEATSSNQEYGTGRKVVREVYLLRGNERLAGFGGLGQRPNPATERAIETSNGSMTGGMAGSVLPGKISGTIDTTIGEYTGSAPCWNCEPQPGWGYEGKSKSDYGTDAAKPNLVKGMQ